MRAEKVQKKAKKAGYAVEYADPDNEIGEKLFALVKEAREKGVDPERALERATDAFIDRVRKQENA